MFNLSDKELDRLSREAADAYEVKNNTSSWEALEQHLDKELGASPNPPVSSPRSFRFPFAYASLIILIVGTGYLLLKPAHQNMDPGKKNYTVTEKQKNIVNPMAKASTQSAIDKNKPTTPLSPKEAASSVLGKTAAADELSKEENNAILIAKEKTAAVNLKKEVFPNIIKENKSKAEAFSSKGSRNFLGHKTIANRINNAHYNNDRSNYAFHNTKKSYSGNLSYGKKSSSNPIKDQKRKYNSIENPETDNTSKDYPALSAQKTYSTNKEIGKKSAGESPGYISPLFAPQSIKYPFVFISDSSLRAITAENNVQDIIHLSKKNGRSLNTNRSLQIGLSFAPDFSEVNHTDYANRLGTGIGITLGYQLFGGLSVNTGLVYSHKYYQADDESFHPGSNALSNSLRIEYVNGAVKMLEIPLNLRYDVSRQGNSIFFVNGGLSSYLMLNQNYLYYCHSYNGFGRAGWYEQDFNSPQNFWFSMVNMSAGFETSLSKLVSIQVEPYAKIPLKRVGLGNVHLSSYGVNLSIKVSPVLKRSRK